METLASSWTVVRGGVLLAGLIFPGAALLHALRLPRTPALCFAGSAFSLSMMVLVLQFTGVGITGSTLAGGLAVGSLGAFLVGSVRKARSSSAPREEVRGSLGAPSRTDQQPGDRLLHRPRGERCEDSRWFAPFASMGPWTPLYGLFWAAVLLRAWAEPLAGPDVEFRWGFLAEQMLRFGSLDFYPPRSAGDFTSYFWAESIPPGASALHAWAYACAGGPVAAWTIPGVLLQLVALHELLWRAAHRLGGLTAARFAVLAAAACPLLTWSVLIGQETGLTALALTGIVYCTGRWSDTRGTAWAAASAGFAVIGAMAREYGLVFIALGALTLIGAGGGVRACRGYLAVACLGLLWPARTWFLTGNPVYSLGIGGLFPVNARFLDWIRADASVYGSVLKSAAGWLDVARYLALFAPAALAGWIALSIAAGRRVAGSRPALAGVAIVLVLWLISVPYTNGGLFYSLRVASPALAIGALAAGVGVAAWIDTSVGRRRISVLIVTLVVTGLIPASLALPRNPWRENWRHWPAFTSRIPPGTGVEDPIVALVTNALRNDASPSASPAVVLADAPGYQHRFLPTGVLVTPLWSPQADWLFDLGASSADILRRWRESGVRYLVLTKRQANLDFLNSRSRWNRPPFRLQLVGETDAAVVFLLSAGD